MTQHNIHKLPNIFDHYLLTELLWLQSLKLPIISGLTFVVNMKPYVNSKNSLNPNFPYNLRISNKNNMIDQRRGLIELKPGYHTVVRVVPKVVETTEEFEKYDVTKRKCKLPYETDRFNAKPIVFVRP